MKIESYREPKSSFLSVEKDLSILTDLFLRNNRLKKLLYYTTRDAMSKPALTDEQTYSLFGNQIKIVPKQEIDTEMLNYIQIGFDNFTRNVTNPQFRDNIITFDIICHYDQWPLKDFQLRPYRIAAEIDSMINERHLSGIGTLHFLGASQLISNEEYGSITLVYKAIHGEEDKKKMLNPAEEEQFIADFNELFNSK